VTSIGALSEDDLNSTSICEGYGDGAACVVPANPALRLQALVLYAAANETLREVTVRVTHLGSQMTLFACTSECVAGTQIHLYGLPGTLVITSSSLANAWLTRNTRRTSVLSHTPTMFTQAQAEQAVLRHALRVGDAMWMSAAGGAVTCAPCLQGAVCL
jgi:hypothetical protein